MDDENERTLYVGNLGDQVTEENLWELFLQAGPLQKVRIPSDKDGSNRKSFGFVTFKHSVSVPFTISLMDGVRLFGRSLRLQNRSGSRPSTPSTDQRPPPFKSLSSPFPQLNQMGIIGAGPVDFGGVGPGSAGASPMGLWPQGQVNPLLNMPLSLPPPIGNQFENPNRNAPSFGQYDQHHQQHQGSRGYDDRNRHQRSRSDRSGQRYDPRNSRDKDSGRDRDRDRDGGRDRDRDRDRDGGRDREGPRRWNPLQSHTNFNPQQRHMNPSPHRPGRRH